MLFPSGQQGSTRETEPHHQRSFIGQGCLRPCMVVGEGRGVYARPFAVSGSRVENEVTADQPETARIESWVWLGARTDLELEGTKWNSWRAVVFKGRLDLSMCLTTQNFDNGEVPQEKLVPFRELCKHLAYDLGSWRSRRSWGLGAASCQQGEPTVTTMPGALCYPSERENHGRCFTVVFQSSRNTKTMQDSRKQILFSWVATIQSHHTAPLVQGIKSISYASAQI